MTSVLSYKIKEEMRDTGRRPWEGGGRDHGDVSTSQGAPAAPGPRRGLEAPSGTNPAGTSTSDLQPLERCMSKSLLF